MVHQSIHKFLKENVSSSTVDQQSPEEQPTENGIEQSQNGTGGGKTPPKFR